MDTAASAAERTILDRMPDGFVELDANGVLVYANPGVESMLGRRRAEIVGTRAADTFPPSVFPTMRAAFAAASERTPDGEPIVFEAHYEPTDRWLRLSVATSGDGWSIFFRDVTDRRRTALEAEAKYRMLVEQLPFVVYIDALDEAGSNLYTSPQTVEMLGYTPEEWKADPDLYAKILHPDDREEALHQLRQINATGAHSTAEYRLLAKDGRVVWIRDDSVVVHDAEGRALFRQGFLVDLTERHETEVALAMSQARLRSAFHDAAVGMSLTDVAGRYVDANRAFCELVGYSPEELLAMTYADITHPDDLAVDRESDRRMIAGENAVDAGEKRYVRKDGNIVWALVSTSLVKAPDGTPLHFISQAQDMTEHRRLEAELRQSQKMEAVGRLAGGVAHDFNNLLTAISGYSELIAARHGEGERDRHDAEQIRRSAERAAELTAQLLAFSRRQVLRPRVFGLDEAVGDLEELLRRLLGEHLQVEMRLGAGAARLLADRSQTEQVVVNLAVNARDAMPDGGRLAIETSVARLPDPGRTDVDLPPGEYALLTVSDTGQGMDAATCARVFEPFFTTKPVGDGTGLGLATAYGTVKQSGGEITVTSVPGEGTTFHVYLPLVAAAAERRREPRADTPAPSGSETILLAEDEDVVRALVRDVLESRGYAVLEAAHPSEAIELFHAHEGRVDLLLTDVVMPGMSGRSLAERLAAEEPGLRVLYTSGYTNGRVPDEVGAAGAFIQKPFRGEDLAAKVREVLDRAPAAVAAA